MTHCPARSDAVTLTKKGSGGEPAWEEPGTGTKSSSKLSPDLEATLRKSASIVGCCGAYMIVLQPVLRDPSRATRVEAGPA